MNLKEQRDAAIAAARQILDACKSAGLELTDAQQSKLTELKAKMAEIDEKMARAKKGQELLDSFSTLSPEQQEFGIEHDSGTHLGSKRIAFTGPHAKSAAAKAASRMLGGERSLAQQASDSISGQKGLADTGRLGIPLPVTLDIQKLETVPTTIFDLLPVVAHPSPAWKYLRQTSRTNNAAIVAVGAVKPESDYDIESVDGSLQVFAHMSKPLDKYLLRDSQNLTSFLQTEMFYGMQTAIEAEVFNGAGTAGHLRGIWNTSGIQTVTSPNALTSLRKAKTRLNSIGYSAGVFVMNPLDWEALELLQDSNNRFQFHIDGPVDALTQKVWGTQVVLSNRMTAGSALALDLDSLHVDTDNVGIEMEWSNSAGDDFSKNQLRARMEGRFGLSVTRPLGIVKITLATPA